MASGRSPCRILVVEDELLIAALIEEILLDLGYIVIGPAARLSLALRLLADGVPDAAILDLDVRGQSIHPLVAQLDARRVPFAICSGNGSPVLPEPFQDRPRLMKPFRRQELVDIVAALCDVMDHTVRDGA